MSTPPNTNHQANTKSTPERVELAQAIFNFILTICAIIGIGLAIWQLWAIERQITLARDANEAAESAAKAAIKSNEIASSSATASLRAYVGVDSATWHIEDGSTTGKVTLVVKNYGQTPAYDVAIYIDFAYLDPPFEPAPYNMSRAVFAPLSRVILGPGSDIDHHVSITVIEEEQRLLTAGKRQLQIFGAISYEDIFRERYWMNFQLHWGGKVGTSHLVFGIDGNYEKDEDGNERPVANPLAHPLPNPPAPD
jgi:hypothetical protein